MAHNNSQSTSNAAGDDFMEFMQRGDDFMKVELLRPAKSWYRKALELNSESAEAKHRISECENMLAFENKVVSILCAIAAVTLGIWLLFTN